MKEENKLKSSGSKKLESESIYFYLKKYQKTPLLYRR